MVAVTIRNPASIAPECVFAPFLFGLVLPFDRVSLADSYTFLISKVNANGYRVITDSEG